VGDEALRFVCLLSGRVLRQELVNKALYLVITILVLLLLKDSYQVHVLRQRIRWNELYVRAVRSSEDGWVTGETVVVMSSVVLEAPAM
jgi:hypothetical protein